MAEKRKKTNEQKERYKIADRMRRDEIEDYRRGLRSKNSELCNRTNRERKRTTTEK